MQKVVYTFGVQKKWQYAAIAIKEWLINAGNLNNRLLLIL